MPPLRDIPRKQGRAPASRPTTLFVREMSPELEALGFEQESADPSTIPGAASAIGWVAQQAYGKAEALANLGESILTGLHNVALDLGGTIYAAATGEAPSAPGVIFQAATSGAQRLFQAAPQALQQKLDPTGESNIAGYIYLPDGRKIPIPKYIDPMAGGERAQTDRISQAIRAADTAAAAQRGKNEIERLKLLATRDQWERAFRLHERAAAQAFEAHELENEARRIALDRMRPTQAELQQWWLPRHATPAQFEKVKEVKYIGPGVPGGIITAPSTY